MEYFIEVPSRGTFYRRSISTEEVSPLALPESDASSLPSVRIRFNPLSLAPEQLEVEDDFLLPILKWISVTQNVQIHRPPADKAYGIPFGAYKIEIALPELPEPAHRRAELVVSLDSELDFSLRQLQAGIQQWDYSHCGYSIKWIEPGAFKVLQMLKQRSSQRRSAALSMSLAKEFENYLSGIEQEVSLQPLPDPSEDAAFQISRNMDCYRIVYFVENSIREFVWRELIKLYRKPESTEKWWMGCLPQAIRENIQSKVSTRNPVLDRLKLQATPLHYCSFNELGQIIEKEWQRMFSARPLDPAPFFGHLSYLENIRNAIAHNRPISHGEVEILYDNARSVMEMLSLQLPRTSYRGLFGPQSI